MSAARARGFVLLPVVLALTLLATVAVALNRSAAMNVVDAARTLDAAAARYAAEAGLNRMGWTLEQRNCTGYANLVDVPLGTSRFSATVSKTKGQPVDLTVTATTARGAWADLSRAKVEVFGSTVYPLTLQAGDKASVDTSLDARYPATGYGDLDRIRVWAGRFRGLIKFDLSKIPDHAKIVSATLGLYQTGGRSALAGAPASIGLYRVTRGWTEDADYRTVDGDDDDDEDNRWITSGGDYAPAEVARADFVSTPGWRSWDVTDQVQDWSDKVVSNNGLLAIPSGDVVDAAFVSGDDTGAPANHPKLTVSYRTRCGKDGPTASQVTNTLAASQDTGLDPSRPQANYGASASVALRGPAGGARLLAQFDLSGVVPGTPLRSATLRLYVSSMTLRSGQDMTLTAHAVTSPWAQGALDGADGTGATWRQRDSGAPWANAGGDYRAQPADTIKVTKKANAPVWIEFDVTALAQEWVDGVTPNLGVLVVNTAADLLGVDMGEAGATGPQLVVTI